MVSGEWGYFVLSKNYLMNQIAGKLPLERVTPSESLSSGQFETDVRVLLSLLRRPLISVTDHISWVSETLGAATKLAPAGLELSIRIYVTREPAPQQLDNVSVKSGKEIQEAEEGRPPSLFEDPAVQVTSGSRPNLEYILQKEADSTHGRMGVTGMCCHLSIDPFFVADHEINTVCGSQSLSAGVKNALGFSIAGPSTIMNGGPSITLHTEAFGYA